MPSSEYAPISEMRLITHDYGIPGSTQEWHVIITIDGPFYSNVTVLARALSLAFASRTASCECH